MNTSTVDTIEWRVKAFDALTPAELYEILRLRIEVFVVEQQCIFQDLDNKDPYCEHLMGWMDHKLVAITRLVPPGVSYAEPSIGRVATSPAARGLGLGRSLMNKSIELMVQRYGDQPLRIGAQLYLKAFYESLGFTPSGEVYLEDGIPHVEMLRPGFSYNH